MIQFANKETTPLVYRLWQTCFGDSDEFLNLFFVNMYKPQNTLIYFEGKEAVASLQMLPYTITFYGKEIPFYYMTGLCTLPHYRKRGYMAQLISRAHQLMEEREMPLAILIAANDGLYEFYNKYEYEQVFEASDKPIVSLREILDATASVKAAYKVFDTIYRPLDFCVQKTFVHFETLVADAKMDNYPTNTNLSAMAFVGNAEFLLSLYANANPQQQFTIAVEGNGNSSCFDINDGKCTSIATINTDLRMNNRMLCRLLFGYKTSNLSAELHMRFEQRDPIINYMLE